MLVVFIVIAAAIYVGVTYGAHHGCRAATHLMRRIIAGRFVNTILNSPDPETYTYWHAAILAAGGCTSGVLGDRAAGGGLGCSGWLVVGVGVYRRCGVVLR